MALDIYTPNDLYEVMFDPRLVVSTSQWLDRFKPRSHFSTQEEIMFDEVDSTRKIAPFMLPNLPGRPVHRRSGERIKSFRPAYTKPKDAVRPSQALALQPGELSKRIALQSPEARFNAKVIDIALDHRKQIQGLWQYMGARAVIDGAITINYFTDTGTTAQSVTIDFGRDAGQTVVLGAGSRWGEAGVKPFDNLQAWIDTMAAAKFGGAPTDVLLGSLAAAVFMADADVKDKLDTRYRGTEAVSFNRGLIVADPLDPFTYRGTLGSGIRVWRVSGVGNTFQNNDGTYTEILGAKEVVLVSPAVNGVKAFGAILDVNSLQPGMEYRHG